MPTSGGSNEYKRRSRRDDDGGGDDGGGDDDARKAVGQRGNSGDGGGDDGDGDTARLAPRLASLTRRCARHLSSTHSVHRALAP